MCLIWKWEVISWDEVFRWVLTHYDQSHYSKGKFGHRVMPGEDGGRDLGGAATSQGMLTDDSKHQKLRERCEQIPLTTLMITHTDRGLSACRAVSQYTCVCDPLVCVACCSNLCILTQMLGRWRWGALGHGRWMNLRSQCSGPSWLYSQTFILHYLNVTHGVSTSDHPLSRQEEGKVSSSLNPAPTLFSTEIAFCVILLKCLRSKSNVHFLFWT